jgi:hypothetical protein
MPRGWTVPPEEPGVTEIHGPLPEAPTSRQLRSEVPRTRRSEGALEPVQPGSGEEASEIRWEFVHLRALKRSKGEMYRTIQTDVSTVRALRQITRRGLHSHRNRSICDQRVAVPERDGRGRRRGVLPHAQANHIRRPGGLRGNSRAARGLRFVFETFRTSSQQDALAFRWYTGNPSEGVRCKAP